MTKNASQHQHAPSSASGAPVRPGTSRGQRRVPRALAAGAALLLTALTTAPAAWAAPAPPAASAAQGADAGHGTSFLRSEPSIARAVPVAR
ncbi:hypothetical protein [Streptomyces sp. NPDC048516]|uniref:hypothetical protein n=1 Tax=Streptomyces sp. NPDC048516 TaxID=3365565 RepID=UPI00371AF632